MDRLILVVALAGCAGASPRAEAREVSAYAALFEEGRTWRYRLGAVPLGGDVPQATEREVTCRVTRVVFSLSTTSTIECDAAMGLAGDWIANDDWLVRGGWRVLPAHPAVDAQDSVRRDGNVWRDGDLVCSRRDTGWDGVRGPRELCFGAAGIVRGSYETSTAGGRAHVERFELVDVKGGKGSPTPL